MKRSPVKLVYCEFYDRVSDAFYREKQVQGWSRKKKQALMAGDANLLHQLAECQNETHCRRVGFGKAAGDDGAEGDAGMKLGEAVSQALIDRRKLINYALNPENPVGANKALIFQNRLGYTKDNYEPLLQQIQAQALDAEAIPTQWDEHGQRYRVDLEINGVEGQKETVRTGWMVEPGAEVARLVTLYVRKKQ